MRPKDSRWPAADFSPKSNWRRSGRGLPDERASGREYTLSRADLDLIAKKRTASNQLGFAVLMCGMRLLGRVLDVTETPAAAVLAFIADQVGAPPAQFATYGQRQFLRKLGIDRERQQAIPASAFDRIAREALKISAQHSTCWSRLSSSGTRSIWRWPTRRCGTQGGTLNDDLLRHVAPLGCEHIGLTGDHVWSTADQPPANTLRPLRQRQSLLAA
jgi:hypothetical protein